MLVLGKLLLKNYNLWISNTSISDSIFADSVEASNYFEVKVCRKEKGFNIFVNLFQSDDFKEVYCCENNRPTDKTDMIEYNSYLLRNSMSMPLYKLSREHVEFIIGKCLMLDAGIL